MSSSGGCSPTQPFYGDGLPLPPTSCTPLCGHCTNGHASGCELCATPICSWHTLSCDDCTLALCEECFEGHRCMGHDPVLTATQVYVGDGVYSSGAEDPSGEQSDVYDSGGSVGSP